MNAAAIGLTARKTLSSHRSRCAATLNDSTVRLASRGEPIEIQAEEADKFCGKSFAIDEALIKHFVSYRVPVVVLSRVKILFGR